LAEDKEGKHAMDELKLPAKSNIQKAMEYLHSCKYKEYSLKEAAKTANLSTYYFIRVFKAEVGMTPYKFLMKLKLEAVKDKLADKNLSVAEAFSACGIDYNGHFAAVFRKAVGMSPSQYRRMLREAGASEQQSC